MKKLYYLFMLTCCIIILAIVAGCSTPKILSTPIGGFAIMYGNGVERVLFYSDGQCSIDQITTTGTVKSYTKKYQKKIMDSRDDALYQQMLTYYDDRSKLDSFLGSNYLEIENGNIKTWIIGAVNYYSYSSNITGSYSRAYEITPSNYELYILGQDDTTFEGNLLKITSSGKSQTTIKGICPVMYSFDTTTKTVVAVLQKQSGKSYDKLTAILYNPNEKKIISSVETTAPYGVIEVSE